MTETATTPRNVWRTRAVAAAAALAAKGHDITLSRVDFPLARVDDRVVDRVIVRIGTKPPHSFESYQDAARAMVAWEAVL